MLYDEADLYDTLLPASAAELSYYSNLARNHPTAALELACGSGQSIIPVASLGLSATGLDQFIKDAAGREAPCDSCGCASPVVEGCPIGAGPSSHRNAPSKAVASRRRHARSVEFGPCRSRRRFESPGPGGRLRRCRRVAICALYLMRTGRGQGDTRAYSGRTRRRGFWARRAVGA
jgi:hypothetical protein